MGWLSRTLYKITRAGGREVEAKENNIETCVKSRDSLSEDFGRPLQMTLYNATGGRIIKFYSYDRHNDRSNETVYLVHADENLEEALTKLIAVETMKFGG